MYSLRSPNACCTTSHALTAWQQSGGYYSVGSFPLYTLALRESRLSCSDRAIRPQTGILRYYACGTLHLNFYVDSFFTVALSAGYHQQDKPLQTPLFKTLYGSLNPDQAFRDIDFPFLLSLTALLETSNYFSIHRTAIGFGAFFKPLFKVWGYAKPKRCYCSAHNYMMQQTPVDLNNYIVEYYTV